MAESGEFYRPSRLDERIETLLEDISFIEQEAHALPFLIELNDFQLLHPDSFPGDIRKEDVYTALVGLEPGRGVAKLALKIIEKVFPARPTTSAVSFSPQFMVRSRTLEGSLKTAAEDGRTRVSIKQKSYEGSMTFGKRTFDFDPSKTITRAAILALDSSGSKVDASKTYLHLSPDRVIDSADHQIEYPFPYIDANAEPRDNFAALVEAAFQLKQPRDK